jgi:hypothetical protein
MDMSKVKKKPHGEEAQQEADRVTNLPGQPAPKLKSFPFSESDIEKTLVTMINRECSSILF